jgi:hypothetical protein
MRFAYQPSRPDRIKWSDIHGKSKHDAFNFVRVDKCLYDSDNSGEDVGYFAFKLDDGVTHYFKFKQSWWWENWDSDGRYLANEFSFHRVTAEEAKVPSERDWIDLTQRSSAEPTNRWPPGT